MTPAPDPGELPRLLKDEKLRKTMVALAISRLAPWQGKRALTMSPTDVVQEAIAKVLGGVAPWDRSKRSLEVHLGSVVNNVAWHAVNSAPARRNDGYDADKHERFAVDPAPGAAERMIDHEEKTRTDARLARCWEELRAELQGRGDKEALDVLDLMQQEILDYEEQARLLKKKLAEIKLAHKRIAYHAKRIADRARAREAKTEGEETSP